MSVTARAAIDSLDVRRIGDADRLLAAGVGSLLVGGLPAELQPPAPCRTKCSLGSASDRPNDPDVAMCYTD
jgi:hypothetical protein